MDRELHGIDIMSQYFVEYLGEDDLEIYSDEDFEAFIHSD